MTRGIVEHTGGRRTTHPSRAFATHDLREAMDAFVEKRDPAFEGR